MADTEAPHASEVQTISAEARDLAALDAEGVFVLGVLGSVDEHAMDIPAERVPVEPQAIDRCAAGVGQVQQTRRVVRGETQDRSARAAVVPGGNPNERSARTHVKLASQILAGRKEDRAAIFRGGVDSALESCRVIGFAIARGAGTTRVEHVLARGEGLRTESRRREERGTCAEKRALGESASIKKR